MRKQEILIEIKSIFKRWGVIITDISDISFAESITNTFAQVKGINGVNYLIRFNGKLWTPFSREYENKNLLRLESSGMQSTVIYNDIKNQFQISVLLEENNRLDAILRKKEDNVIDRVSREIKKLSIPSFNFNPSFVN